MVAPAVERNRRFFVRSVLTCLSVRVFLPKLDAQINKKGIMTLYHILNGLSTSIPLRYLHLRRNRVPNEQELLAKLQVKLQEKILETYIVDQAREFPQKKSLSLNGSKLRMTLLMDTNLTDHYVKVALDTIRRCAGWSALEELDLSGNAIAENGAYEIGLYVSLHPALRVLNLSTNQIGGTALHLADITDFDVPLIS